MDLTVENAGHVSEFYSKVAGWQAAPVPVDDYEDFCVGPSAENVVAGICHAKGANADIPPSWMIYINVDDARATWERAVAAGYKSVMEPERLERWPVVVGFVLDPDGYLVEIIQHDGARPGE